jgi:hypothetical protein
MSQKEVGFLLIAMAVAAIAVYQNPKALRMVVALFRANKEKLTLLDFLTHSVIIGLGVILMSSLAIKWLWPVVWENFLVGDLVLFTWIVIGVLFLALLRSVKNKEGKVPAEIQKWAFVFQLILVIGIANRIYQNPYWKGVSFRNPFRASAETTFINPPPVVGDTTEAALAAICQHESQCQQFNADGSVRKGKENPHDIGKWQINEEIWADEIEEQEVDIYTAEGNRTFAEYLYGEYGAWPWLRSMPYWAKNVAGRRFVMRMPAPVGKFGPTVPIPSGFSYSIKSLDGCYEVENNAGEVVKECVNAPLNKFKRNTEWIRFRSTEKKEVWVKISFFPYQN